MTTQSITQKLHDKADAELKEALRKKFWELRKEFTDGCCKTIKVLGGYVKDTDNTSKQFVVDAHAALKALEELSFLVQVEKNREFVVNNFLQKVDKLAKDLEEIQASV